MRSRLNFFVDVVAFIALVILTSTGVIMRFILPPGSGRWLALLGMDRHQWGSIHFAAALAFLVILLVHFFLHWRWILSVLRGGRSEYSGGRFGLGVVGFFAVILLAIAPVVSPVAPKNSAELRQQGFANMQYIRGNMTLGELEKKSGVPMEVLISELGAAPGTSSEMKLGRMGRKYNFRLPKVRKVVHEYQRTNRKPRRSPAQQQGATKAEE